MSTLTQLNVEVTSLQGIRRHILEAGGVQGVSARVHFEEVFDSVEDTGPDGWTLVLLLPGIVSESTAVLIVTSLVEQTGGVHLRRAWEILMLGENVVGFVFLALLADIDLGWVVAQIPQLSSSMHGSLLALAPRPHIVSGLALQETHASEEYIEGMDS